MIHVLPLRKLIRNKTYHYFLSCLRNVKIRRSVSFIKMDSPPNWPRNRKKAHQMPDCKCDDKSALHAYLESMHSRMLYIPNYNNGLNKGNRIFIIFTQLSPYFIQIRKYHTTLHFLMRNRKHLYHFHYIITEK